MAKLSLAMFSNSVAPAGQMKDPQPKLSDEQVCCIGPAQPWSHQPRSIRLASLMEVNGPFGKTIHFLGTGSASVPFYRCVCAF
jgi:hypothetical protein